MRHIIHYMEKYEDVGETLKSVAISILVTTAILGLAPMIMLLQAISF